MTDSENTSQEELDNSRPRYIQRCPHDKENPYAQTSRALIRDNTLHPSASWMLIYLLSMKDGWKITPSQLINHVKGHYGCGRNKVYEWIHEACEAGYMKKEEWLEGGLKRCRYLLSEYPKFKKCLPRPDPREPVSRDHKKEYTKERTYEEREREGSRSDPKTEREKSCEKDSPPAQTHTPSFFSDKRVKMKMESYQELVKEFGNDKIKDMIERLEEYADINPKRFKQYANHATVIRKWIREDAKNPSKSTQDRIKKVQAWLQSHKEKKSIQRACVKNLVNVGRDYIEFVGVPDGHVRFESPKAEKLIEHYIGKVKNRMLRERLL